MKDIVEDIDDYDDDMNEKELPSSQAAVNSKKRKDPPANKVADLK
jgi:hypothetical protein